MIDYGGKDSRRRLLKSALSMGLASFAAATFTRESSAANPSELRLPEGLNIERWDFEAKGIDGWTVVSGQ